MFSSSDTVWKIAKNASEKDEPIAVHGFNNLDPKGIVMRKSFFMAHESNTECQSVIQVIRKEAVNVFSSAEAKSDNTTAKHKVPMCYNYCLHGTCHVSSTGYPKCECQAGFSGERCEFDLCNGYCLNGGRCSIENGEPNCQCTESYKGSHCELMSVKEMCTRFCDNEEVETGGLDLRTVCGS